MKNNIRYSSLDGLRALAAIGIVMMHVQTNLNVSLSFDFLDSLILSFTNFTFLFMILSAFGMCCGYYEKFKTGNINFIQFYKKRYTRILPFFSMLVLVDIILKPSLSELYEGFADLTLAFGLLPNAGISVIGVGWFLGVVFVFYMIFPFFVFLINNKYMAWFVMVVSCLLHILSVSYFSRPELLPIPVGRWNIVYSFPFFVAGGLVFLYRDKLRSLSGRTAKLSAFAVLIATVIAYCLLSCSYCFLDLLLFSALLVYALIDSEKKGILNNRVVRFLSEISMEIYLCHMLFYRVTEYLHLNNYVTEKDLLFVLTFVLTILGAIVFSWCWKRFVEPRVLLFLDS